MPIDLIKRFSSTPLVCAVTRNGTTLRVATNEQLVLDRLRLSGWVPRDGAEEARLDWRIVVEQDESPREVILQRFTLQSFGHEGLMFVRISHGSFLAADCQAHWGISFIDRRLIENEGLFEQHFFPAFTSLVSQMAETS